ncbi:MAG: hypothetical protein ACR2QF_17070 [Geminicoccaceae bacterium]
MDDLSRAIEKAKDEISFHKNDGDEHTRIANEAYKKAEAAKLRYEYFVEASKLRPPASDHHQKHSESDTAEREPPRRGRKKGSLTRKWIKSLGTLYLEQKNGSRHSFEDIKRAHEQSMGRDMDPSSIRERIGNFKDQDPPLMIGNNEEGYLVTEEAARRFGFENGKSSDHRDDMFYSKPNGQSDGYEKENASSMN